MSYHYLWRNYLHLHVTLSALPRLLSIPSLHSNQQFPRPALLCCPGL